MTPERQRVKIAEACGWKPYSPGDFNPTPRWINSTGSVRTLQGFIGTDEYPTVLPLPDYLNSLDAMHDAEKTLIFSKRQEYFRQLQKVMGRGCDGICLVAMSECILATAAQKAEAILKALNLWEE